VNLKDVKDKISTAQPIHLWIIFISTIEIYLLK